MIKFFFEGRKYMKLAIRGFFFDIKLKKEGVAQRVIGY